MTIQEFTQRTKFEPTYKYFEETIHPEYMAMGDDVDKDTFCKLWLKNGGIQKAYDAMCIERNNTQNKYNKLFEAWEMQQKELNELYAQRRLLQYKLDKIKDVIENE